VSTHRARLTGALLALATIGLGACALISEPTPDYKLSCGGTPDDVCVRVADLADRDLPLELGASVSRMTVGPTDCVSIDHPGVTRCWYIEGTVDGGPSEGFTFAARVHEHPDGTLGRDYTSQGAPPDE
jgi:hypothetical protein